METWPSGLRHLLGKQAGLTTSAGSNPAVSAIYRSVAQMGELRSPKPVVGGSNPSWPATLERQNSQNLIRSIKRDILHISQK